MKSKYCSKIINRNYWGKGKHMICGKGGYGCLKCDAIQDKSVTEGKDGRKNL